MSQLTLINLSNPDHRSGFSLLLDDYHRDAMGNGCPFPADKLNKVIADLSTHPTYRGYLFEMNGKYVALANCFVGYSTFQAKPLLNIHDFVVLSSARGNGIGAQFLKAIEDDCRVLNFCRINLEVRDDNLKAQALYRKVGFKECVPNMYFWEKYL